MAVANLLSIGSIATHIVESISVSAGISGNMVEIVDQARQHVANYVGETIGSNAIGAVYQPAIINFAKADAVDLVNAEPGGKVRLGDLSIDDGSKVMSAKQYRMLGDSNLKSLGRKITVVKSLS
jgi:hypothetical protein